MLSRFAMPWDFLVILAILAVVVPWRGSVRVRQLIARPNLTPHDRIFLYASTIAFQWLAAGVTFWRCIKRGLSWADLGLVRGDPGRTVAVALGAASFLALMQWIGFRRLRRQPLPQGSRIRQIMLKLMPEARSDSLVFIALVCTVAICEEFLYRGFAFAAIFRAANNSVTIALVGSSVLFALAHSYQGRQGLLNTFLLGLIFAACRAWTTSLLPPMLAHLAVDLMAGFLIPRGLKAGVQAGEAGSALSIY
ncbi:MAG: CPBP family intramembrane glutamic endopeptidase [Candidatus Acidiferrales bacterium]